MPQRLTCVSRCFPGPDSVPPGAPSSFMSGWITRVCCRPACCLPEQTGRQAFVAMTEGKTDDLSAARALGLPKGSIVVMDRGYNDYAWYNSLNNNGIFFVTRLKTNAQYRVIKRRTVPKNKGLTCDQTIQLTGARAKNCPIRLRPACSRQAYRVWLNNNVIKRSYQRHIAQLSPRTGPSGLAFEPAPVDSTPP